MKAEGSRQFAIRNYFYLLLTYGREYKRLFVPLVGAGLSILFVFLGRAGLSILFVPLVGAGLSILFVFLLA